MEAIAVSSSSTTEPDNSDVHLRPLEVSDLDDFMVWATDKKTANFCVWEPYTSREDGINFIKSTVASHPWYRAICLNGKPIGSISVCKEYDVSSSTVRGRLGYAISSNYWGRGITPKAVKLVLGTIFKEWPDMERLEAFVDVENAASHRVLDKCGFKKEGLLRKYMVVKGKPRDMVLYSFLSTDPRL